MSRDVDAMKAAAGEYWRYALEARKEYLRLLSLTDKEITAIYHEYLRRILWEYRNGKNKGLEALLEAIESDSPQLHGLLAQRIKAAIEQGAAAGITFTSLVTIDFLEKAGMETGPMVKEFELNRKQAVAACYARTHKDGLFLSDRIWNTAEASRKAMRDIVQAGIGEDAAKVARALEVYVKQGKTATCLQFPNMMKRMGSRVPENLDYNALRLARTELTAAYGAATIGAAEASPAIGKIQWMLSGSHPKPDICDTYAKGGDGHGVYDAGKCPVYPAHPNCLCIILPAPDEPEDFIRKMKEWEKDPSSHPDIEAWHQKHYGAEAAKGGDKLPNDDEADIIDKTTRAKVDTLKKEIERQQQAQQKNWTVKRDEKITDLYRKLETARVDAGKKGVILTSELEKSYGKAEIDAIRAKVKAAPENIRVVWNRFEGDMRILDTMHRGTAAYSPSGRGIRLDLLKDQTDPKQKPFSTTFHEIGHLIDHCAGKRAWFGSYRYNGGILGNLIKSEASDYITQTMTKLKRYIMAQGYPAKIIRKQDAYTVISKELETLGEAADRRDVSDIWHGATNKKVHGGFGHFKGNYWADPENLPTEAFAEMFCATINNPQAVENIKKYFPKAYEAFEQMLAELAEKGTVL